MSRCVVHCLVLAFLIIAAASCEREREVAGPASAPTPNPFVGAGTATLKGAPGLEAGPSRTGETREALRRAVAGISLGMKRQEVESLVGELTCHTNPLQVQVCRAVTAEKGDGPGEIEVYFFDEQVVSLAYETAPPADVWTYLDVLRNRYGKPSLRGHVERDREGRLHEVYGWKDAATILAVRFIWQEGKQQERELLGTATTVWDREVYEEWEAAARPQTPARGAE